MMVESISAIAVIAANSFLGHSPILGHNVKDCGFKRPAMNYANRLPRVRSRKGQSMELSKEVYNFRDEDRFRKGSGSGSGSGSDHQIDDIAVDRKPGKPARVWPPNNKADNPLLQNPLVRQERMGCGWLGAIFEWEGVVVEEDPDHEKQSWVALAEEEGKSRPPGFLLSRIEGMKNEHAIAEVLCWSRDPSQLRRMSSRKEQIFQGLQGGVYRFRDGSKEFINVLTRHNIPMAVVSTRPRKILEEAIASIGITEAFSVVVAAEDVCRGKPDPEMFAYAGQLLGFIPERCIVFGNSNLTVEAAHEARMKCVAVASKHRVYELTAADLVVRWLDELSVVDLKNLADVESEFGAEPEVEMELEKEDDAGNSSSRVAIDDLDFW